MSWEVILAIENKKLKKRFDDEGEAKKYCDKIEGKVLKRYPKAILGVVNILKATPYNLELHGKRGEHELYCPYCGRIREFKENKALRTCSLCGMSNHDFYVKMYNGLGGSTTAVKTSRKKGRK